MSATRIAASLPVHQFEALEEVRRRLNLKRSEAIQQALALWLAERDNDGRRAQYIAGYQAHPEDDAEGLGGAEAWATGLEHEAW